MADNEREAYMTRLPQGTAENVEEYREERELTKSEAVRQLTDQGLRAQDGRTLQNAYFIMTVQLTVLSVWLFCTTVAATVAVSLAGVVQVSPVTVAGGFGLLTGGAVLGLLLVLVIRWMGLGEQLDGRTAKSAEVDS